MSENPFFRGSDPADDRHRSAPSVGAQDRHAEVVGGTPVHIDRSGLAESVEAARNLVPPIAAPSPFVVPVPAETMRAAIKEALNSLLLIDLANDEEDETYAKLRTIAAGLIEAL